MDAPSIRHTWRPLLLLGRSSVYLASLLTRLIGLSTSIVVQLNGPYPVRQTYFSLMKLSQAQATSAHRTHSLSPGACCVNPPPEICYGTLRALVKS